MLLAGAYVSFPLTELIKENEAEITLKWKWYAQEGADSDELKDYKGIVGWKATGFQHTPSSKAVRRNIASIN